MTVGIDYDGTWTAAPAFWREVVALAPRFGVGFVLVTNRGPNMPVESGLPMPVVYANGRPKRQAAAKAGWDVQVWVDDYPHLVDLGHGSEVARGLGLP